MCIFRRLSKKKIFNTLEETVTILQNCNLQMCKIYTYTAGLISVYFDVLLNRLGKPLNLRIADILRVSKFRVNLWISYFFDDITTIFGPEKTLIRWRSKVGNATLQRRVYFYSSVWKRLLELLTGAIF